MDYKYIEQLLERFWECQTSLEEEAILRAFFSQEDVPASLLAYRDLFVLEQKESSREPLGEAFDKQLREQLGEEPREPQKRSISQRLMPLWRAVAIVAVVITLSNAIRMSIDARRNSAGVAETVYSDSAAVQVAHADSLEIDSVQHTSLAPQELTDINFGGSDPLPMQ